MKPRFAALILLFSCYGIEGQRNRGNRNNKLVTVSSIVGDSNSTSTCAPSDVPVDGSVVIPYGSCGANYFTYVSPQTRTMRRGRVKPASARVLGISTKPNEVPWQIRMISIHPVTGILTTCGGAIISPYWVITAAHCVLETSSPMITIHAGGHCMDQESSEAVSIRVRAAYRHRKFNRDTLDYDIGLLQLRTPLTFNNRIQPICIPQSCEYQCEPGDPAVVSGWGTNGSSNELSNVLKKAKVNIVTKQICERGLRDNGVDRRITTRMLCAGNPLTREDTCEGDEGGPLACQPYYDQSGRYYLTGVKSVADRCGVTGFYSIYTRPCSVIHWINDVTRNVLLPPNTPPPNTNPPNTPPPNIPPPNTNPPVISASQQVDSTTPTSVTTPNPSASQQLFVNHNLCGSNMYLTRRGNTRIVGGIDVIPHELPWQTLILIWDTFDTLCGGTLINERWIVTAAHCLAKLSGSASLGIYLGAHNQFNGSEPNSKRMYALKQIVHPDYEAESHDNDIALIKLTEDVQFSDYIRPICMLQNCGEQEDARTSCIISGWGKLGEKQNAAHILQKASVPILTNSYCQRLYITNYAITDNMLCAGYPESGGIDTCQGDSGGPLVCSKSGSYYLNGVTSFGEGCARRGSPGVYSRACQYIPWIVGEMAKPDPESTTPTTTTEWTPSGPVKKWENDAMCGTNKYNNQVRTRLRNGARIINGIESRVNEVPWQVYLTLAETLDLDTFFCGGSLINHQWIVTASHCLVPLLAGNEVVVKEIILGGHDTTGDSYNGSIIVGSEKTIMHPMYDADTNDNDIALVKMNTRIEFNDLIRPVCLMNSCQEERPANTSCVTSGYGVVNTDTYEEADKLQKALVPLVSKEECQRAYSALYEITEKMICAGYKEGGIDACQGDSGGPLFCQNEGVHFLHGITSFGKGCAEKGYYGVYARPCKFTDWISYEIEKDEIDSKSGPQTTPPAPTLRPVKPRRRRRPRKIFRFQTPRSQN